MKQIDANRLLLKDAMLLKVQARPAILKNFKQYINLKDKTACFYIKGQREVGKWS